MVFSHREQVLSNLARLVVMVWGFVVLILIQSYTANLTSMLTVQQLQPSVSDVHELIKSGENVGYPESSFILGLLLGMNFDASKLRAYTSMEECDEAFSRGRANGGIAAAFDEIPSLRVFLARYPSKYTMVGQTYETAGIGFVFPRGSPLVPDVSRAILKVTESNKIVEIEKAWFGQQTNVFDPSTTISSTSLGLDSFWGLFLIAAMSSLLALIIYLATFIYEHRHILTRSDPEASFWRKMGLMVTHFNQKDPSSHTQ